jgi:hypothetical protein
MSYNIGQFRRSDLDVGGYETAIDYSLSTVKTAIPLTSITFTDKILNFTKPIDYSTVYYLRFTVSCLTSGVQNFSLILQNDSDTDNTETIGSYTAPIGTGTVTFEIIFQPNNSYNSMLFELQRSDLDFKSTNGRAMTITINKFVKLTNIVKDAIGVDSLKKIGIQGPPGLLFTINGEEIQIGRSGIYELYNNNIAINYLGFVLKNSLVTQNGTDYFIVDYKY